MTARNYRIEPLPGYTPVVGMLVGMLTYARDTTVAAVTGLSVAQLDHLHDDARNGRGQPLEHYVHDLAETRRITLEQLATRDDAWLARPVPAAAAMNAHFAWFHVAEDEINHRGQIRWLRARLPHA